MSSQNRHFSTSASPPVEMTILWWVHDESVSDGQQLFFFVLEEFFDAFDLLIGELLYLFAGSLLIVGGDCLVLRRFFDSVVTVAADVTDGGLMIFCYACEMLHRLFTALLGHGWDG